MTRSSSTTRTTAKPTGGHSPPMPAVGIVTHDSQAHLESFLETQLDAARRAGMAVIIVDNGSGDGSAALATHLLGDRGEVIANLENRGYAAAVNQIFSAAPGRDVMLLNPDVEVTGPEPLQALISFLERTPAAGAVGPRLINDDGTTQASARSFPSPLAMAGHASAAHRLPSARRAAARYLRAPRSDAPSRVDWLLGAAMLVRRDAFDEVGGWDEGYFLYLEDTDFCRRLADRGWQCWYVPEARMRHLHARRSDGSGGSVLRSGARRAHVRSMARFFSRYPELISSRHLNKSEGH